MEKKKGRRSATAAEETKNLIMTVAAEMFCELGYERVSIRNISERAGVSHSLIRHHFGSKEQIWYGISDHLHAYMQKYIRYLLDQLPEDTPANVKVYRFAVGMLAHCIVIPQPIQLIADAMRQENEFFDYFIDSTGEIESIVFKLVNDYNANSPQTPLIMHELKWKLMMFAHGSACMLPMLKETWSQETTDLDECLVKHWSLFEAQVANELSIGEQDRLKPKKIDELVYQVECDWGECPR
ncbi:TetR/AcrR family transcriptional regulator [Vibrio mediterranei]|uniref:TetR family transcriptional regulator n=1 Tax=Vibrio mediterranei TaxID=689 RepID=A0AAN1KPM6_9VIBR|nr:TetR/AcrR family transcriptional regulator [Vibrio mediterranei]ASI91632.1 TetR family transcriptional regulator [Vibrio mediterranei]NOI26242.1 TetR/AcrR family transcriptional regulator [Vibrio mediterranei]